MRSVIAIPYFLPSLFIGLLKVSPDQVLIMNCYTTRLHLTINHPTVMGDISST